MATTTWSEFLPHLLPEATGISGPLAEQQIREAVIEFCEKSWCWVVDQGPFAVAASVNTYDLEPPSGTQAVRLLLVWLDKKPIDPKTMTELAARYGDYNQVEGEPECYLQEVHDQIILVPKPTANVAGGLTAKLAVKPTRSATGLDTKIADRHWDALVRGAKARVFGMSNQTWSNETKAKDLEAQLIDDIAKAKVAIRRGLTGAPMRARAQFM